MLNDELEFGKQEYVQIDCMYLYILRYGDDCISQQLPRLPMTVSHPELGESGGTFWDAKDVGCHWKQRSLTPSKFQHEQEAGATGYQDPSTRLAALLKKREQKGRPVLDCG